MSDFAAMKIADLKKELKAKGLPTSGNKQELVERLQAAVGTDLLDDDLDQEEEEQLSDEAIKKAEAELQAQGDTSFSEADDKTPGRTAAATEDKENSASKVKITSPVVAVDQAEEKIKARAERFGGFQSDEAKKVARAARFGGATNGSSTTTAVSAPAAADVEMLKKRAERFGAAVSPLIQKAELSEAIKRRQERFGVVSKDEPKAKKVILNAGVNSVILDEKMKARKERFGL